METRAAAGSLGPRLAGRLTAELILRSPQYMSCVKMYEVDMRGNKIAAIENLGATENQFDSIDLSDNAITRLEGFPKLHRLRMLLLSNNRINRISRNLEEQIPSLEWLILSNNRINRLEDLDPLCTLPHLRYLSLLDNPVSKQQGYRLYLISKCKHLKVLDFRKVKQKIRMARTVSTGSELHPEACTTLPTQDWEQEREEAAKRYGTAAAQPDGAAATFEPEEELAEAEEAAGLAKEPSAQPAGPTQAQMTAIKAAIANAATLEEVHRLENALKTGIVPSEVQVDANGGHTTAMEEG